LKKRVGRANKQKGISRARILVQEKKKEHQRTKEGRKTEKDQEQNDHTQGDGTQHMDLLTKERGK